MPETLIGSEIQKMLPEAIRIVVAVYIGDQLSNLLETLTPEQRDQCWRETARKLEPFSEKITCLRQAIKDAHTTKEAYPKPVIVLMQRHFRGVEDIVVRELLTDLLFARTVRSPGYMDYGMEVVDEAEAMATELDSGEGLQGKAMKSVDLDQVIESVLSGNLRLTRQTQLE
ncbi:MAG: hypothetical protein Q8R11_00530 [bacterium]|nr:hypothetical protein [bacterium]